MPFEVWCANIALERHKLSQIACLVDPGASFDTPGPPGGGSIVEIQEF